MDIFKLGRLSLRSSINNPNSQNLDIGLVFGILFLLLQLVLIINAHFGESRHFSWSPYTTQIKYKLSVTVNGQPLSRKAIKKRYGFQHSDRWEAHSIQNLIELIKLHEQRYSQNQHVKILLTYSINGHKQQKWTYTSV